VYAPLDFDLVRAAQTSLMPDEVADEPPAVRLAVARGIACQEVRQRALNIS
jgi:hypothetical protein